MLSPDSRGDRLRSFDRFAAEFKSGCLADFETEGDVADKDVQRLADLAESMVGQVADWAEAVGGLAVARCQPIEPALAGRLILESVFDAALTPSALRVLAAALDLALDRP